MIWLILCLCLMAFTPIYQVYDQPDNVRDEFRNVENSVQDQQHTVFTSTPNLIDVKDGAIFMVSSGTATRFMMRIGQELYSINVSCITVRR